MADHDWKYASGIGNVAVRSGKINNKKDAIHSYYVVPGEQDTWTNN